MTLTGSLIKSTVVAALGGLLFGFDTAVIAGTTAGLTKSFALTPTGLGLTVAVALVGTVVGAIFASVPGDRYGRRDSLRVMAILYLISAVGCGIAWDWYSLLAFRFLGGLGIGGSSVLGPMYIAEIAPAKWRGRLVGCFQINVVAGILLAYLSNYLVGLAQLGPEDWRWMLGVSGIPALLFFIMLFTIPRSPRWLAQKSRLDEARRLCRLWEKKTLKVNWRKLCVRSTSNTGTEANRCFNRNTASRFFWRCPSACSTSCRGSTPFFTI